MKRVDDMEEENSFCKLKYEIYQLSINKEYDKCISRCDELIGLINKHKIDEKKEYLWYAFYHKGIMYSKINQYDLALKNAKESLKYVGDIYEINNNYSYTMWLLAKCYENLYTTIDEAIDIYKTLSRYYKMIGYKNLRISTIFNQAVLLKNTNRMMQLIKIVEQIDFEENECDLSRYKLLEEMNKDIDKLNR